MSKRIRTATGAPAPVAPDATLQFFTHVPAGALGLAPGEEVRLSLPSVALHAGGAALGVGTLRVSTLRVAWLPDAGGGGGSSSSSGGASASASASSASASAPGYVLEYPRIVLHAICRDAEALHSPCLYCQVSGLPDAAEGGAGGGAGAAGAGEGDEDEDMGGGGGGAFDVYFAPSDAGALDGLFKAMTACAELHPDPQDEQQEGEEGEGGGMDGGYAWAEALMAQEAAGGGEAVAGQFEPPAAKE